jgi:hypothetical protein
MKKPAMNPTEQKCETCNGTGFAVVVVDAVRDLIPTADPQEQEKSSASPDNKESATRSP